MTHWNTDYGEVYHYICPKCGRILHQGTMGVLYCDPCDDWFMATPDHQVIDEEG